MIEKQTKVSPAGFIPVEWGIKTLQKVATVEYGISDPLNKTLSDGIRIIGLPNVSKDGVFKQEAHYFIPPEKFSPKVKLQFGDILFNWRNGSKQHLGKTFFFDFDGDYTHVGFLLRIRKHGDAIIPRYLDAYLKFIKQRGYFLKAKIQVNSTFNKAELLELPIVLPPLPEQRKIAEILSTWDNAIAKTEQLIAALQIRKKGLMQRLLSGEVRFAGFDGEWGEVVLGNLGTHYPGLSGKTKDDFGKGLPFIPYKNIFQHSSIDLGMLGYVDIGEGEKQNKVEYGDIFFTTSSETPNEVAMSSILLTEIGECYLNSFCFGFRLTDFKQLLPEFAQYLLRGFDFRRKVYPLAQGSTRYNVSKKALLKLMFNIPELDEQRKIADVLLASDTEIELHEQKLSALQEQKKGLMQRLLTGQVRVRV
jgi:restriction endonuclease S subunit